MENENLAPDPFHQTVDLCAKLIEDKQVLYNGYNLLIKRLLEPGNVEKEVLISIITDTLSKSHS